MAESALLAAVAAQGLAGSRTDPPATPLSRAEWFDVVQACRAADLVGFLGAAAASGRLPVSPGQADELAALDAERATSSRLVERRAAAVASILAAGGIDHCIVDGPARRLAYGDADVRHIRCVQVLVAADRLAEAAALERRPPHAAPTGRLERWRDPLVLRVAPPGAAGDPPVDGLAAMIGLAGYNGPAVDRVGPVSMVALDGLEMAVLDLEHQLVVACADAAASPVPGLALLRDLAQIALSPALDAAAARRLAEADELGSALALGVARAWSTFDLADKTELSVWALRIAGAHADRAAVRPPSLSGLAQRMLGRRQPGPAAAARDLPSVPPSMTGTSATRSARVHWSPRT
jgi:hypothetical protein